MVWDVVGCCTTRFYDVQIANYYKLNRLVAPLLHMHLALLSKFTIYIQCVGKDDKRPSQQCCSWGKHGQSFNA